MNLLTYAGYGMIVSALFHFVAFFLGGMSSDVLIMLIAGAVYLGIGYGLIRQVRLLACATFVIMLIGINVALANAVAGTPPAWAYWAIVAADLVVALCLFGVIWRGRKTAAAQDAA
ncbi:MAG: hypothetical protein AAF439_11505 [Pseudomonadota bacterium]